MKSSLLLLCVVSMVGAAGCSESARSNSNASDRPRVSAQRGEYLVTMMGCHDCHTPLKLGPHGPEPDMTRPLSGHPEQIGALSAPAGAPAPWAWSGAGTNTAFAGPWGISYTANLTPDQNTGLGIWTEEMFVKAIRTGRHMGTSRPILPPMPWPAFRNASDDDLKSIYAYLRTIKPITNHVPDPQAPQEAALQTGN